MYLGPDQSQIPVLYKVQCVSKAYLVVDTCFLAQNMKRGIYLQPVHISLSNKNMKSNVYLRKIARGELFLSNILIGFYFSNCKNCNAGPAAAGGPFYLISRTVFAFPLIKTVTWG